MMALLHMLRKMARSPGPLIGLTLLALFVLAAIPLAAESQEACANDESDEPCAVTAAELVEAFQSGMGMGQLFKEYSKPSMLGVGHVKQQMKEKEHGNSAPVKVVLLVSRQWVILVLLPGPTSP